jgi:ribosomal protein L37E
MVNHVWKTEDGRLFMLRCPKCEQENYALAVAHGECAWCGYVATEEDINP